MFVAVGYKNIYLYADNMAAEDLSFLNKSLPLIDKKLPKIMELSNFNKILKVPLLMNEFHNELVILSKN